MMKNFILSACAASILITTGATARNNTEYSHQNGLVERIQVYGESLENNVTGAYPSREVMVYLPPSYYENDEIEYPVVYALHGFGGDAADWFYTGNVHPDIDANMDKLIASGDVNEMIIVALDAKDAMIGSWYQNSEITGNWQDYILQDLIPAIDDKFRTIDDAEGRGLIGFSMGGYGAITTVLEAPEMFSAVAAQSPTDYVLDNDATTCGYIYLGTSTYLNSGEIIAGFDVFKDFTYLYRSIMSVTSAAPNNPPSYVKSPDMLSFADFIQCDNFDLPSKIKMVDSSSTSFEHIALRTEVGNLDLPGFGLVEATAAVTSSLGQLGMHAEFHEFDGGHLDKRSETIDANLIFLSKHLAAPQQDD
ncbi:hypothetical protein D1Z90_12425 [Motilimonas pumila]|uniref:Esterase n=2 Tax=Motilimonas pumila TaxID=2303987 RepID=A0A418YDR4_9GAMM|nr:hypothetical protein D1Z90_12425 [Motilimonas pumila]